jgi:glycosyltransferase involved in cell wall biosynthesis
LPNHAAHAIQILKTAESLARLPGVGVTVYCVSLHAPAEDVLRQYGIAPRPNLELRGLVPGGLHRLFRLPPLLSPHRHFLFRLAQWRMLLDIERAARRGDAVFYTRNENMLKLFAPRARRLGMPVILELHWLKHIDRFRSFLARGGQGTARPTLSECRRELERLQRKEAAVIALADGVLCLTGPIRRRLERWGLAMPMEVLPSGVDPTLGAPDAPGPSGSPGPSAAPGPPHSPDGAGPPDGAAAKPFDVAYCGQLYPWKGVDGLVRAMAFLPGRRVALIGGADDEDRRRVERLAEELGVADRIVMTGQVGYLDVPRLLAQARACVLPAPRRGFVEARRFSSPLKLL